MEAVMKRVRRLIVSMPLLGEWVSGPPRDVAYRIVESEIPATARLTYVGMIGAGTVSLEFEDESFEEIPDDVVPPYARPTVYEKVG